MFRHHLTHPSEERKKKVEGADKGKPRPISMRRFLYKGFHISLAKYTMTPGK